MTKPKQREDDIIIYVIVILSILIETFIDAIKCLISLGSRVPTPAPTKCVTPSSVTTPTLSGKVKTQRLSPSTKRPSTTGVQKKVDGGTKQATQSRPTASSTRSKRSKTSSTTVTSTEPGINPTSGSRRRSRTTTSTSPTTTLSPIPQNVLTTADDTCSHSTNWSEHQPTEFVSLLPESQEEVQEHTVLRTKVSRSKLKD
jgi:hypothetical protein